VYFDGGLRRYRCIEMTLPAARGSASAIVFYQGWAQDGKMVAVETSSNDPALFWQARDWVKEKLPELIEKPCQGIWDGGPTPGDCVRAMVEGYGRFAASDDFPQK
jgi:hypothetical protein